MPSKLHPLCLLKEMPKGMKFPGAPKLAQLIPERGLTPCFPQQGVHTCLVVGLYYC